MNKTLAVFAAIGVLLAGCGGDDNGPSGPRAVQEIAVPGVGAGTNYSFDISTVSGTTYYYTDRNNAAVNAIDIPSLKVTSQITGTGANAFAGAKASNAVSGPDGLTVVGTQLYAGDVNSVKVIDQASAKIVNTITVGTAGVRADESCYDAVHGLFMVSTPEAPTPYASFINPVTQTVVATVTFTDSAGAPSAGLEQCRYDPGTDTFYVNNDGTTANPHGELDALPGAAIRAIAAGATVNYTALAGVHAYGEGNCDPTGLALGPGTDIAVGCREATTAAPLLVQILNRNTGVIVKSVNAGGGDQIEYDVEHESLLQRGQPLDRLRHGGGRGRMQRRFAVHASARHRRRDDLCCRGPVAERQQRPLGGSRLGIGPGVHADFFRDGSRRLLDLRRQRFQRRGCGGVRDPVTTALLPRALASGQPRVARAGSLRGSTSANSSKRFHFGIGGV